MYHDVMVMVLAFLTLFRWPGFPAVVGVFGMVNFPSEEVTVFGFYTVIRSSFWNTCSFSSSVLDSQTTVLTWNFLVQGARV